MTLPEEIEELKVKLENTADEKEQAELLLQLLEKYRAAKNTTSRLYIERLYTIAATLNNTTYLAYAKLYEGVLEYIKSEYPASLSKLQEALELFQSISHQEGIANTYSYIGMAHNNTIESLKNYIAALNIFEQIGEKKGIAECYTNIGVVYYFQANYSEALKSYFASLKIREEIGDKSGVGYCYGNIGGVYCQQGNYPEALKNEFAALKVFEQIGHKSGIAKCYSHIGDTYENLESYPEALKNYFDSLKIYEEIGDRRGVGLCYGNIGSICRKQGNYPEALKNDFAALKVFEQIGDKRIIGTLHNHIGSVYTEQTNYPEALKEFFTGLKIKEEIGDKSIADCYNNIGYVYLQQDNYSESLRNHLAALKIREEIGDKSGIRYSCSNIGDVYSKQGKYREALEMLHKAEKIADEMGTQHSGVYLSLSEIHHAIGNYEEALQYYKLHDKEKTKILGAESQKQLTNLRFTHDLETKEKDLEIAHLRNVELKKERDRSETLLLNILPAEVAEELKEKGTADAKLFDEVTVLFTDFKSFTTVSERLSPQELVNELNECFKAFDEIIGKYNIEKIKTVGDAYLAAAGLPSPNQSHADDMVKAALEIRDFMLNRKKQLGILTFEMRVGIHSGSVVAGIVGVKKFAYDIWGDTVNTAARMEQNGVPGKVNISHATYALVKDKFTCECRGEIEAKNKGKLKMYFVE